MAKEEQVVSLGNMYDFNKAAYEKETPLDPIYYNKQCTSAGEWIIGRDYSMLLCRERFDYTIFHKNFDASPEAAKKELWETLNNRGEIMDFELNNDGAWEIWIRDFLTHEPFVYYLFDYSSAIVEVK